jgi:N-acetylglutamate synthase-like GNAT family acetyltransferase
MIRAATASDIPQILSLINENLDKLLPRETEEIEQLIQCFYVEEIDSRIVGCCCLEVYSKKIAEIRTVAVSKDFRNQGIGTKLVQAALEEGKKRNIYEIMVVTSSLDYFAGLGFSTCMNEKYAMFWSEKNTRKET